MYGAPSVFGAFGSSCAILLKLKQKNSSSRAEGVHPLNILDLKTPVGADIYGKKDLPMY